MKNNRDINNSAEKNKKNVNAKKEKKSNNIMTYAVIMIVSVIIIIIFAAMADSREEEIDNRIMETERANETIQHEIVTLKEENYKLTKKNEGYENEQNQFVEYNISLTDLTNVWNKISSGDIDGAITIINHIDSSNFDENQMGYLSALCKILGIDRVTKQPIN